LVENSIAQVIKSSIIIRNSPAFYNYNFEIGERRTAKGEAKGKDRNRVLGVRCRGGPSAKEKRATGCQAVKNNLLIIRTLQTKHKMKRHSRL
jgi:hypothetical protein